MGIQKDVLVWSTAYLSATPTLGSTFTVTGAPDMMAFKDDETTVVPGDFDPAVPSTIEPNQTLSGTLDGTDFTGNNATDDVFEFERAFQVTDGTNTFNIYQIDNDQYGGTTVAYVSEVVLDPTVTYTVLAEDDGVNFDNGTGYETTPIWADLAGQVDGTSGDDTIGTVYVDDDDDRVNENDGDIDYIVGEGGGDSISSGVGDDVVYGDHVDDLAAGTTEYIAQGFFRDVNFELESGSLALTDPSVSISGTPLEIRFIDNDLILNGDTTTNETPDDADQRVEINGVLYNYSADFVIQMNGSDGQVYNMLVIDVDRNSNGVIDLDDPTADPGDVDYESGQILIPRGDVPPPGVTLTAFAPTYDLVTENYSALNGAAVVSNYDDSINAGVGDDTVFGGLGDDTIQAGLGNDSVGGGTGSDRFVLSNNAGADVFAGGEDGDGSDIDVLDASGILASGVSVFSTNEAGNLTQGPNTATFSQIESFILTDQDDSFSAFATSDVTVDGGGGNDTIQEGNGNNTLSGGDGDDVFEVGFGTSTIDGGGGTDTLSVVDSDDPISVTFDGTGFGTYDDISDSDSGTFTSIEAVQGSSGTDIINATNDGGGVQLSGNGGDDTITGGAGDNTIDGGSGADTLTGGAGADRFIVDAGGDIITDFDPTTGVDGGVSNDNDFVDLTQFYNPTTLAAWNAANPGNEYATQLGWLRADQADGTLDQAGGLQVQNGGSAIAASSMYAENTGVVCFTKGTCIATTRGEVPVENLEPGDLVQTMDHGLQPIRWIGVRHLSETDLIENPNLRPIRISPKVMGLPAHERDLVVSPQHRILVTSKIAHRMLGDGEVLIAATKMRNLEGVEVVADKSGVTYYHVLCDEHEILFANGIPAESLYLGRQALKSLSPEGREEIRALFPELVAGDVAPYPCRKIISGNHATTLCRRHAKNRKPLRATGVSLRSEIERHGAICTVASGP